MKKTIIKFIFAVFIINLMIACSSTPQKNNDLSNKQINNKNIENSKNTADTKKNENKTNNKSETSKHIENPSVNKNNIQSNEPKHFSEENKIQENRNTNKIQKKIEWEMIGEATAMGGYKNAEIKDCYLIIEFDVNETVFELKKDDKIETTLKLIILSCAAFALRNENNISDNINKLAISLDIGDNKYFMITPIEIAMSSFNNLKKNNKAELIKQASIVWSNTTIERDLPNCS